MTPIPKKLVVFSDGTWQSAENPVPTNVLKLTLALKPVAEASGQHQVIFYDAGLGTEGNRLEKFSAGAGGAGIDKNIVEMYTFLASNYEDGDEIYLFGFSRGSYTVRSLAGLINESGLVRRENLGWVKKAYDFYRENEDVEGEDAQEFRETHGSRVPITLLACFDTVGSLGLPGFDSLNKKYEFHDTNLSPIIQNAIHLLAIDEDREVFSPTLMEACPAVPNQLTQKYFPGGHGGVGGGSAHFEPLSDCALRYMVDEIKRRGLTIEFDEDRIPDGDPCADVPLGQQSTLFKIISRVTGKFMRTIENTELLHAPIVKARYRGCPDWRPPNLAQHHDRLLAYTSDEEE